MRLIMQWRQDGNGRRMSGGFGRTDGEAADPPSVKRFTWDGREGLLVRDLSFFSLHRHSRLPFTGTACLALLPARGALSLGRLGCLIDLHARRFQTPENLAQQIATAASRHLRVTDVAVVLEARRHTFGQRGLAPGTQLTTALCGFAGMAPVQQQALINLMRLPVQTVKGSFELCDSQTNLF